MTAMSSDVNIRDNTPQQQEPTKKIQYPKDFYAYDTLMFGNCKHNINLTANTDSRSMELSPNKCITLTLVRQQSCIKFGDSPVPRSLAATYLGTLLTDTGDNKQEVINRIAQSTRACNRLKLLLAQNPHFYLMENVFHSILRIKLLYWL